MNFFFTCAGAGMYKKYRCRCRSFFLRPCADEIFLGHVPARLFFSTTGTHLSKYINKNGVFLIF